MSPPPPKVVSSTVLSLSSFPAAGSGLPFFTPTFWRCGLSGLDGCKCIVPKNCKHRLTPKLNPRNVRQPGSEALIISK